MTYADTTEMIEAIIGIAQADMRKRLNRVLENGKKAALKSWLAGKDSVHTLQVTVSTSGALKSVWQPGERSVAVKATQAILGDSVRDFAGVRSIGANETTWLGSTEWGDDITILAYWTE